MKGFAPEKWKKSHITAPVSSKYENEPFHCLHMTIGDHSTDQNKGRVIIFKMKEKLAL